jgi:hypothetical protein
MIRMTAIVSSMVRLLRRCSLSNGYATSPSVACAPLVVIALQVLAAIALPAELAGAQERLRSGVPTSDPQTVQPTTRPVAALGQFLGGGAIALGAHESGHLLFDTIFQAHPGISKVTFHGLPFFAITHDPTISRRREFVIDSAGFWVQEGTNEWLLHRHPDLRHERAPLLKGVLAFNVLASAAYAGAAFARTGPVERDTRGMAASLRWKEPAIGALIIVPAILDAVRYYRPAARWAAWGSRSAKVASVVLIVR